MDINEAGQFREKLDEVLADTEEFVKAGKQLTAARKTMEEISADCREAATKLSEAAAANEKVTDACNALFSDNFAAGIKGIIDEIESAALRCDQQAEKLEEHYNSVFSGEGAANLLYSVAELKRDLAAVMEQQKKQDEKLDRLLKAAEANTEAKQSV